MRDTHRLAPGLYELVIDEELEAALRALDERLAVEQAHLDDGESHAVLAQHMAGLLRRALASVSGPDRVAGQVALCNRVIRLLAREDPEAVPSDRALLGAARRLLAVWERAPLLTRGAPPRPQTPLSASCLLTGTRIDP